MSTPGVPLLDHAELWMRVRYDGWTWPDCPRWETAGETVDRLSVAYLQAHADDPDTALAEIADHYPELASAVHRVAHEQHTPVPCRVRSRIGPPARFNRGAELRCNKINSSRAGDRSVA